MLRHGVIIDATNTLFYKNKFRQRDPEIHQTHKGNQWYFGMKAHIDIDAADRLITAPVEVVFPDAGYHVAKKQKSLLGRVKYWFIVRGPHAIKNFRQYPIPVIIENA